ncbi:hypothetical protein BY458DRAFT_536732 [Sporodiniella umbellata]|nr:hypothetical protein BY458DRAFT_536732 [Sporodiniella umbellata]
MIVKSKSDSANSAGGDEGENNEEDENDEGEESDEDEEYESVDQKNVITGYPPEGISDKLREIATVNATATDTIEFKKLIQLSDDHDNGPLLDLRISMFGDEGDTHEKSIRELLTSVETHLELVANIESDSRKFLFENKEKMKSFDLSSVIVSPYSALETQVSEDDEDPFEKKHKEMSEVMKMFRKEIFGLQNSLKETEKLVQNIQSEMSDTKNKMETYIKDIPESHYSACLPLLYGL